MPFTHPAVGNPGAISTMNGRSCFISASRLNIPLCPNPVSYPTSGSTSSSSVLPSTPPNVLPPPTCSTIPGLHPWSSRWWVDAVPLFLFFPPSRTDSSKTEHAQDMASSGGQSTSSTLVESIDENSYAEDSTGGGMNDKPAYEGDYSSFGLA